jgi:hypothetical protein
MVMKVKRIETCACTGSRTKEDAMLSHQIDRGREICTDLHVVLRSSSCTLELCDARRVVEIRLLLFDTSDDDVVDVGLLRQGP